MSRKTTGERQKESDQDHRKSHDGETDVRDEQWEIDVANQTLALKMHVTVEGVIGDIGQQENRGKNKRGEHGRPVLADPFHPDEKEADNQGDSGESIEQGV